jgi:hypothetical protein
MFRALLAHLQEAQHERGFGGYCVLKLIMIRILVSIYVVSFMYIVRTVRLYWLDMSKSDNSISFFKYRLQMWVGLGM